MNETGPRKPDALRGGLHRPVVEVTAARDDGRDAGEPDPCRKRKTSAVRKSVAVAMTVPATPYCNSPEMRVGFRPTRSATTPATGVMTMVGAVNREIISPTSATDAPSGPVSVSRSARARRVPAHRPHWPATGAETPVFGRRRRRLRTTQLTDSLVEERTRVVHITDTFYARIGSFFSVATRSVET